MPKGRLGALDLFRAGLRSLFLESSFNNEGKQNLGFAAALYPALRKISPEGAPLARKGLLRPFSTNPFLSGLLIGVALSFEEERLFGGGPGPMNDELVACLASALGAKGDQLFWNTWLQFSSLVAFVATWRFQAPWGPFLLPLLFAGVVLPLRFLGVFQGYRRGLGASSERLEGVVLTLRRRMQAAILFAQGLVTALLLDGVPGTDGLASPRVLIFAVAAFASILLGGRLVRKWPRLLIPAYAAVVAVLFLLFTGPLAA